MGKCYTFKQFTQIITKYRLLFDLPKDFSLPSTLLHFGAVDWSCSVYVNGKNLSIRFALPIDTPEDVSCVVNFVFRSKCWKSHRRILWIHFWCYKWEPLYLSIRFIETLKDVIRPTSNELIVFVYDPSDKGAQPNGKQRISAINDPGPFHSQQLRFSFVDITNNSHWMCVCLIPIPTKLLLPNSRKVEEKFMLCWFTLIISQKCTFVFICTNISISTFVDT